MDTLPIFTTSTANTNSFALKFSSTSFINCWGFRNVKFRIKQRKVSIFASNEDSSSSSPTPPLPKLDEWDRMELKFGKLLGEDPKLTLAKIMARKVDPDVSYMEVEKSFAKNKGKFLYTDLEEIQFEISEEKKQTNSLSGLNLNRPVPKPGVKFEEKSVQRDLPSGLNLNRPVPKNGVKFETGENSVRRDLPSRLNLNRPVPKNGVKFETEEKSVHRDDKKPNVSSNVVPNVILRKPSVFNEVDDEKSLPINFKPKLSWEMEKALQKERNNEGFTLLERPKPQKIDSNVDGEIDGLDSLENDDFTGTGDDRAKESEQNTNSATLLDRPEPMSNTSSGGLQPNDLRSFAETDVPSSTESRESDHEISADVGLIGKPKRFDQSVERPRIQTVKAPVPVPAIPPSHDNAIEENLLKLPIEEHEEKDWISAEYLAKIGGRAEVEVISSNTRGFTVSFGSLIGFLPYRNLAAKWRFLAFESWIRKKGLDPSRYKQNLGVIGSFKTALKPSSSSDSMLDSNVNDKFSGEISPDMKIEDLLRIYDNEKLKFLSSFVGQKIKVAVVLVDKSSRRLIFSTKAKEKEDLIEKKRNLMGKLNVGDVVKCCIKKITYFGIFVEVEGVPALILQTEVSWDSTLDPASYFKVGQVIDAKVHQLDFSLQRIFLSLKEIMPDPLAEGMEAVGGDHNSLYGKLEAAQPEGEWTEVESLIEELRKVAGIQSVSKGRYFLSPGSAPTFQVYMASMTENQYKLLARSENKAQEVMVESTLSKEEMKSVILTCTNRVQ